MSPSMAPDLQSSPMAAEAAYDLAAPFYDTWKWQSFWHAYEYPLVREALARYRRGRSRGLSILDIGCGTGWYLSQLGDLVSDSTGIDLSAGMLAIAQLRLPGALLLKGDARSIHVPPARFDAVICTRVLAHVPNTIALVREARRALKPGGIFVMSNIDASYNYEVTRLPALDGRIVTETYKHDRTATFDVVAAAGFVPDVAYIICENGMSVPLKGRRRVETGVAVVEWIGSWRRTRD